MSDFKAFIAAVLSFPFVFGLVLLAAFWGHVLYIGAQFGWGLVP